ncbi:MAG: alpha/beta hydrolase [Desulfobacterota bacterium]|nr:alpha/beta hydrolase [Thermodesulfobacteriota bacterium]
MPTVCLNGAIYHYRTSQRSLKQAPAVICIHGSGASSVVWSYQISRLNKYLRIIAPDLPGHGESEGHVMDSAWAYAQWLQRFVQSLGISSLYLCGHSFGGAIAQEFTRCFGNSVKGLILISTGVRFVLSRIYRMVHEQKLDPETEIAAFSETLKRGLDFLKTVSNDTLHADLMAAGAFDSSQWIKTIQIPVMILWGDADVITPYDVVHELWEKIPRAKLEVIPNASHVAMTDAPQIVNAHIKRFVECCESGIAMSCTHNIVQT